MNYKVKSQSAASHVNPTDQDSLILSIGPVVKKCRELRTLTLQELSAKTGFTKSYLSRIENGQRDPTLSSLKKISLALDVPLNILILLSDDSTDDMFMDINNSLKKIVMDTLENGKKLDVQK
ncbi:TPA: helix-turn-helix domain-containing protein [Citrobacter werkmanii]